MVIRSFWLQVVMTKALTGRTIPLILTGGQASLRAERNPQSRCTLAGALLPGYSPRGSTAVGVCAFRCARHGRQRFGVVKPRSAKKDCSPSVNTNGVLH